MSVQSNIENVKPQMAKAAPVLGAFCLIDLPTFLHSRYQFEYQISKTVYTECTVCTLHQSLTRTKLFPPWNKLPPVRPSEYAPPMSSTRRHGHGSRVKSDRV